MKQYPDGQSTGQPAGHPETSVACGLRTNGSERQRTAIMAFTHGRAIAPVVAALVSMMTPAHAETVPITIVAIGASNTWGWGVGRQKAYPERLEALLKASGYDTRVTNAGVIFDTTAGMLRRLDSAVPDGTKIVILQPGGNDLRFFGTKERRAANIAAMESRLRARNIEVIVFDPVFPPEHYQWDRIHITSEGHAAIASQLLPQITAIVGQQKQ
jgi:acyl-CoA thioesterase-1